MSRRFSFCAVSDMHMMAWKDSGDPVEWVPDIERYIREIAAMSPDFLVSNGDQTNGKERDWRLASAIVNKHCPFPVYYTMGNHEYYGYYEEEAFALTVAQRRFLAFTGHEALYYEVIKEGVQLLFLSTETYAPDMNDAGWLSAEQLAWLEHKLSAAGGPAIVFFHQPLNDTVAASNGTCVQSAEMKQILGKRPGVFFVSGHTHCRMDQEDQLVEADGIRFVGGGCLCGDTPQSRWFDVYDNRIAIKLYDHRTSEWMPEYERIFDLTEREQEK